jgi:hypothetical protein
MTTATTHPARRTGAKAKRTVRNARTKVHPRRVARQVARSSRSWGVISIVAVGTVVVLGAAAFAAAAFDPRVEETFRRGWRDASGAVRNLPSHLPDHLPEVSMPSMSSLENVARQFSEAGQRLGSLIRGTANRF